MHDDEVELGTFEMTGTKLMVTDPCYERDTWCQGVLAGVRPGTWVGVARYDGHRVSQVEAHLGEGFVDDGRWDGTSFEVGVDSGQAGIFDEARYPTGPCGEYDEPTSFYGRCCRATLPEEPSSYGEGFVGGGVVDEGVVTSSGWGDGGYMCEVHRRDGLVDGVRVTFIDDDDEEDDEEQPEVTT